MTAKGVSWFITESGLYGWLVIFGRSFITRGHMLTSFTRV